MYKLFYSKANTIQWVKSDNPNIVWLMLDKGFLNTGSHLFIACTYLSPCNSFNKNFDFVKAFRDDVENFAS